MTNLVDVSQGAPVDKSSRWIIKEIAAVARSATDISRRSHAGAEVPIEERVQLQQRKIALLEAINRCPPTGRVPRLRSSRRSRSSADCAP
jgi:hypothetical protein